MDIHSYPHPLHTVGQASWSTPQQDQIIDRGSGKVLEWLGRVFSVRTMLVAIYGGFGSLILGVMGYKGFTSLGVILVLIGLIFAAGTFIPMLLGSLWERITSFFSSEQG